MNVMDTPLRYLIYFAIGGSIFSLIYYGILICLLKRDREASITETVHVASGNPLPSAAAEQLAPLLQSPPEIV